ncbi:MAG: hypothetical protein KKG59_02500 [Nanoarchaeota archaeon]|nr:hypothetical protein [Nanoarchaeota archaeon]MBU1975253.1 hypothetical protein [Nanoarchaeota archaeon]
MERKLVRQGRNALTVTLPAKWLRKRGLEAGDVIKVLEKGNSLRITTDTRQKPEQIKLDLRNHERNATYHKIIGAYVQGYDKILVQFDDIMLVQEVANILLGMIVEEYGKDSLTISSIISVPEDNFAKVLRRATHLLTQQAKLLVDIALGDGTLVQMKEQEHVLDYNLRYCMRYINKYLRDSDSYKQFLLCATLESAGDLLSGVGKCIGKDVLLAKNISKMIDIFTECLFTKDFMKVYTSLMAFRRGLEQKKFVHGLCFCLEELLYDNLGLFIERK